VAIDPLIRSDGRTVWVDSPDGYTVARFSLLGVDIHTATADGCLDCRPGPTTLSDWIDFRRSVASIYGAYVDDTHRPAHLAGDPRAAVVAAVRSWKYSYASEHDLQAGLAEAFDAAALPYQREVRLTPRDRIDFVVDGTVGVEVKVKGSDTTLLAQLLRYSKDPRLTDLVVVTTRVTHRRLPGTVGPCTLTVIYVGGGL